MTKGLSGALGLIVIIMLAALLVAEASLYAYPLKPMVSVTVTFDDEGGEVVATTHLVASYSGSFRQTYLLGAGPTAVSTIYYYYDSDYFYANSNVVSWFGLAGHLSSTISVRGLRIDVVVVNAAQLATVLENPNTTGELVVMASGAFPSTVFSKTTNIVSPWVRAGGKLFWIGAPIGYYTALAGTPIAYGQTWNPGAAGVAEFLNQSWLGGPGASGPHYQNATPMSAALNLQYPYGEGGSYGFNMSTVVAGGGQIVGQSAKGYSNAALIPYGAGAIVDLAGTLYRPYEDQLAINIVNMIQVGLFRGPMQVSGSTNVTTTPGSSVTLSYSVATPMATLCVFTQQTDLTAMFGTVSCAT